MEIPTEYLFVLYIPVLISFYLGYRFVYKSDKFGSIWIGILMFTLGLWGFTQTLSFRFTSSEFVYASQVLSSASAIWFFLFSLEYTMKKSSSVYLKGMLALFFIVVNASLVMSETNLVVDISETSIQYLYTYELLVQVFFSSLLYFFSVGILIREALIDIKKDKVQDIFLIIWASILIYFSSHSVIYSETSILSVVVFILFIIFTSILCIVGMRYYGLFNLKGLSYSNLLRKIEDGYIALDKNNNIIERDYSFDKQIDENKVKEFILSDKQSRIIHMTQNYSTDLYYRLDKKLFKYGVDSYGTLVLVTDISNVKQKEKNLQLLRQVFSRFLRHNIRNRLTVINGFINTLDVSDTESKEAIETINESTDELLGNSQKALVISNSTAQDIPTKEFTIKEIIEQGITSVDPELMEKTRLTTKVDENKTIKAHEKIPRIIQNAVENSIEHNPKPVEISIISQYNESTSEVHLMVEDNGQGIDPNEIQVIDKESESPLEHGTGIGLWAMKILTKESEGLMHIIGSDFGSEIHYTFLTED